MSDPVHFVLQLLARFTHGLSLSVDLINSTSYESELAEEFFPYETSNTETLSLDSRAPAPRYHSVVKHCTRNKFL